MATTAPTAIMAPQVLDVHVDTDSAPPSPAFFDNKTIPNPRTNVTASSKTDVKAVQTVKKPIGMVRFRVPKKSECFIAPGPDTYDGMIALIKRECPSLADFPADKLTLHVTFDPAMSNVHGVMFRVLPQCWPGALTDSLKLVAVRKVPGSVATPEQGSRTVTPIQELTARERMAFSEEMPDAIEARNIAEGGGVQVGTGEQGVNAVLESWVQAVEQQVVLGDGQQVGSTNAAPALEQAYRAPEEVIANSWADLAERQAMLGDH